MRRLGLDDKGLAGLDDDAGEPERVLVLDMTLVLEQVDGSEGDIERVGDVFDGPTEGVVATTGAGKGLRPSLGLALADFELAQAGQRAFDRVIDRTIDRI